MLLHLRRPDLLVQGNRLRILLAVPGDIQQRLVRLEVPVAGCVQQRIEAVVLVVLEWIVRMRMTLRAAEGHALNGFEGRIYPIQDGGDAEFLVIGAALGVGMVGIGPIGHQQIDVGVAALPGREQQRRVAGRVFGAHVGAPGEQPADEHVIALLGGPHQRREAITPAFQRLPDKVTGRRHRLPGIGRRSRLEQGLDGGAGPRWGGGRVGRWGEGSAGAEQQRDAGKRPQYACDSNHGFLWQIDTPQSGPSPSARLSPAVRTSYRIRRGGGRGGSIRRTAGRIPRQGTGHQRPLPECAELGPADLSR